MRRSLLTAAVVALFAASAADAGFPGRNGLIAFSRDAPGYGPSIYTVRPDGRGLTRLTTGGVDMYPRWSRDGRSIAFFRQGSLQNELRVMNADGSGQRLVAVGNFSSAPAWTPDGRILVARQILDLVANPMCISAADLAGAIADLHCRPGGILQSPRASATGRIAFFQDRGLRSSGMTLADQLWTMAADGSAAAALSPTVASKADWSPDGSRLVQEETGGGLSIVAADGSGERPLIGMASHPSWSPDGRSIAFARGGIFTVRADGKGLRRLTKGADWGPDWQPR